MKQKKYRALLVVIHLLIVGAHVEAQDLSAGLTEEALLKSIRRSSPGIAKVQSQKSLVDVSALLKQAQHAVRAEMKLQHSETDEVGLSSFDVQFSPRQSTSMGLSQSSEYGIQWKAQVFSELLNTSDGTVDDATRVGTRIQVEVDLLKNLLGRYERESLRSLQLQSERAQLQSQIGVKELELELRKLYWSWVANEESLRLSQSLVVSSQKQLKNEIQKMKRGASDVGVVARTKAQFLSRQKSVSSFQYIKEILEGQMKTQIPELVDQRLLVPKNIIEPTVKKVLYCIDGIIKNKSPKEKESDYFEIIKLLSNEYQSETRVAQSLGDWDLKLSSYYQNSVVANGGISKAWSQYEAHSKSGYGVGLVLSVPLEGDLSQAEKAKKAWTQKHYQSSILDLKLKLEETHKQIIKSLIILQSGARIQGETVQALATSLKSSQKKYHQARISFNELVREQDTLFQSRLEEIQTRLAVLKAIYDYFKVYNHSPCSLNQM